MISLDLERVRAACPERLILWRETTGSTMTEAARLAAEGCPSGTVVGADEQTAGQGRLGRSWHSEKATGLYVSIVLRLPLEPVGLPVLTLALGLAAAEAITRVTGIPCDLRWPNDVLVGGKKCAGILVQLLDQGAVVAGIGINVNQTRFPPELEPIATSLRLATGREYSREPLLIALLAAVDSFVKILLDEGPETILRLFSQASSYVVNRRVAVDQGERTLTGVTEGLDPSGFLILRREDGTRTLIVAGGVRPLPE
ncbi:MAG: biotin--[acetyl-CoA-carboxylase] ligase [Bryobacterales bacterium]|nr:biotin--[acetyl-CoA-carboxylase] ligase [Bryobacteraceae bacterium]MDW8353473.1 biotin--[acetyl-CoA-carboxylase] ligase [Bryobacterales bacterium]